MTSEFEKIVEQEKFELLIQRYKEIIAALTRQKADGYIIIHVHDDKREWYREVTLSDDTADVIINDLKRRLNYAEEQLKELLNQ